MIKHNILPAHQIAYINDNSNDYSNDNGRYNIPKPIEDDGSDLKEYA